MTKSLLKEVSITAKAANQQYCHLSMSSSTGPEFCRGRNCMAWIWDHSSNQAQMDMLRDEWEHDKDTESFTGSESHKLYESEGYCGLLADRPWSEFGP